MFTEKTDPKEAAAQAERLRCDPKVRAWMRRARKLFADLPPGTWIYWQESNMNLMARGPDGEVYHHARKGGSDQAAVIDSVYVSGSDAGAW